MVDRVPDVAGESSTHILTEAESDNWQDALITGADAFAFTAADMRSWAEKPETTPSNREALLRTALEYDARAKRARDAAELLADAIRVEIVRTAPEGGAA